MEISFQKNVISYFLVCLLCFTQFSSISCEKKVSLTLYYESLCPYCSNFIVNYLPKIFKNGMIDIVDFKLVPWGNTKLQPDNTFKCQVIQDSHFYLKFEAYGFNLYIFIKSLDLDLKFSQRLTIDVKGVDFRKNLHFNYMFDSLAIMGLEEVWISGTSTHESSNFFQSKMHVQTQL